MAMNWVGVEIRVLHQSRTSGKSGRAALPMRAKVLQNSDSAGSQLFEAARILMMSAQ
jgi:hypothetical protein